MVELAIVAPVLIIMAIVVLNLMVFVGASARFDRVAPDVVIALGVAPASDERGDPIMDMSAAIEQSLNESMGRYGAVVEVELEGKAGGEGRGARGTLDIAAGLKAYRCSMVYTPRPRLFGIAGFELGAPLELRHDRVVVIDPWKPSVVV